MKAKIIILTLVSAFMLSGCGDKNKEKNQIALTGQWELIDIETKSVQIGEEIVEVYIEFKTDKTFSLWQKLGRGRHRKYSGTWSLTGTILTGKYSDGKAWGANYEVGIESGNLVMTEMKTGRETCIYRKCTIPSDIQ